MSYKVSETTVKKRKINHILIKPAQHPPYVKFVPTTPVISPDSAVTLRPYLLVLVKGHWDCISPLKQ